MCTNRSILNAIKSFYREQYLDEIKNEYFNKMVSVDVKSYIYKKIIENTNKKFVTYSKLECTICMEKMVGYISTCPSCKQRSHSDCLMTQLLQNGNVNCPYCRQDMYKAVPDNRPEAEIYICDEDETYPDIIPEDVLIKAVQKAIKSKKEISVKTFNAMFEKERRNVIDHGNIKDIWKGELTDLFHSIQNVKDGIFN